METPPPIAAAEWSKAMAITLLAIAVLLAGMLKA